ncbi:hypothetical protein RWE15_23725 [Virgibacillus halophilus]|uniref:Uncharacterized protein n=1 Tax=Tigheibacillus halophilus TaxID=361280 RepID=A0ABU5CD64_9BACI|nr:hypothetical protein [Virgibacillus halophilus]
MLNLVSITEDDEIDMEEIKEKMRELQKEEKKLQKKLDELNHNIIEENRTEKSVYALEEAVKYYLTVKGTNLKVEQRQKLLRMIIREVEVVDPETVNVLTF